MSGISGVLFGVTRLRLWLSLLAGLFFGPFQVELDSNTFLQFLKSLFEEKTL